jgi:hypothetical protein
MSAGSGVPSAGSGAPSACYYPVDDNYAEHDATDQTEHDENEERRAVVALLRPPGERLQE